MAEILYTRSYLKRCKKFIKSDPELLSQYTITLKLMEITPFLSTLRSRKLHGKLSELYSVSTDFSYRIWIYFILEKDKIIPVDIGTHDEIYYS
jgi:toxin HigB-1